MWSENKTCHIWFTVASILPAMTSFQLMLYGHVKIVFQVSICMKNNVAFEPSESENSRYVFSLKEEQLLFNFNGFHTVL